MKIVFSGHALKQLKERKISKKIVLEAVNNPAKIIKSYRDRQLRQKSFGGKILEVITFTEEDVTTVITEYFLEEEENV